MTERRRRSPLKLLNPFARIEKRMSDDRLAEAVAVVEASDPGLHDREPGWFGGSLEGDVRARYVAVGYTPVPDRGLEEGRLRRGHPHRPRHLAAAHRAPGGAAPQHHRARGVTGGRRAAADRRRLH